MKNNSTKTGKNYSKFNPALIALPVHKDIWDLTDMASPGMRKIVE
jgi:hypothetical protein